MKKSRYAKGQIVAAVQGREGGRKAEDLCRELGVGMGSPYKWKRKYGGLGQSEPEAGSHSLKRMYTAPMMACARVMCGVLQQHGIGIERVQYTVHPFLYVVYLLYVQPCLGGYFHRLCFSLRHRAVYAQ